MSSINDLLNKAESRSFVGRNAELQLMQKQLLLGLSEWNILHFYGIKGIGKTTLLKRFANTSTSSNIIYVDTDVVFHSTQQFLTQIAKKVHGQSNLSTNPFKKVEATHTIADVIDSLNTIAHHEPPLILLFDSLELWSPITEWLFESFIPKLSAKVRLFTAGREALEGKWMSSNSWSLLVKNIPLKPLKNPYVYDYLNSIGIIQPALQNTIAKLSNGIPFAMNLCFKMTNYEEHQFEDADFKRTIRVLCKTVLDGLEISTKQHTLLEAAAVVAQFDKELLMYITEQELDYEEFDQFCKIQIVMKGKDGWSLLDGVRNWIQTDFKEHSPELFNRYKKRALKVLHRRWIAATPIKRRSLFLENIYAVENKLLQEYYFLGDDTIYDIRVAREEDIPLIEGFWKNRHLNTLQSVNDGTEQEKLFRSVWRLEPTSFKTFWENDHIVGFTSIVSFTKQARDIFQHNELYRNYLVNTKTEKNECLIWVGATAEKNDYEALNAIFRYFFEQLMDNCLYTVLLPTDYEISGLLALGFNELPWATSVSPSGKEFRMLQLDLREISLLRLLTTSYPDNPKKDISPLEAIQWTKKLLVSFHDFESDRILFEKTIAILGVEEDCNMKAIQEYIKESIQEVAKRTDKDRVMMRVLQLTYIEPFGSNEMVAERLHLSISTFYRYSKNGIEKLTLHLLNKNGSP